MFNLLLGKILHIYSYIIVDFDEEERNFRSLGIFFIEKIRMFKRSIYPASEERFFYLHFNFWKETSIRKNIRLNIEFYSSIRTTFSLFVWT